MNNKYITFNILDNLGLINLYTTNNYDFNIHTKNQEELNREYNKLEKDLNYHFSKIIIPLQSHSNNIKIITKDNLDEPLDNIDGVITKLKDVALTTCSADCQNILLYDAKQEIIASIHSGWRGTLNSIIKEALKIYKDQFNANLKDIYAVICPSIQQCCFEVDTDVKDMFETKFGSKYITKGDIKENKQKYHIDTVKINLDEMLKEGLLQEHIYASDLCVCCHSNQFHSYRSNHQAGRNIGLIAMKK